MSEEMQPDGIDELPAVDEVLAQALTAQGERGVRALGLLRDARRVLAGIGLERPGEVAESCLRGAADALLSLPGAPLRGGGLKAAAAALLDALAAAPGRTPGAVSPPRSTVADPAVWDRVDAAVRVLRGELERPGGRHRWRAVGIAEHLMGVQLGAAQEEALDVWGEVYGKTSDTLHGKAADADRPARLYAAVVAAARELLVPLPDRAARVLQLTALERPSPDQALELARWADPRATTYFFRSEPAPAWLPLLQKHAPHLLLPDAAVGAWPAAPFFEHLAATAPQTASAWLADHAVTVAAAGRRAREAVLRLAGRDAALVPSALVRAVLDEHAASRPAGEEASLAEAVTLRLAAEWACAVPMAARDRDWILVAERLLQATVDAEHAAARHLRTAEASAVRPRPDTGLRRLLAGDPADWAAAARADSARMPEHLAGRLLKELIATTHPGRPAAAPHGSVRMIRAVAAALLVRDVSLTAPAARRTVFHEDLDRIRLDAPTAFGGPLLARAVLDLAAADAAAGESLAERTAQWHKTAAADGWLADRIWAAHLAAGAPGRCLHDDPHEGLACSHDDSHETPAAAARPEPEEEGWHELVHGLVPRLLADHPHPEPARLVAAVWRSCTPRATAELEAAARAALGRPPTPGDIAAALPQDAGGADGTLEPLTSWLRVWDWAPVLPTHLLTAFVPLLDGLRRLEPDGPADPRTGARPVPVKTPTDVDGIDLLEFAAEQGPLAAARVLAATKDAGADGHAHLISRLVAADPAAWTADVPAVLAELKAPVLRVFYLCAAQAAAHRPGDVLPGQSLAHAVAAALQLHAPGPAVVPAGMLESFAEAALFGLLAEAWRRPAGPAGLDSLLPTVLAHLHTLAKPLTHPAADLPTNPQASTYDPGDRAAADGPPPPHTAVRALECLLDCTLATAIRPGAAIPDETLHLLGAILTTSPSRPAVSSAFGARLLALSICTPNFTARHHAALTTLDGGPTPAAAWLHSGPAHPPAAHLTRPHRRTRSTAPRRRRPRRAPGARPHRRPAHPGRPGRRPHPDRGRPRRPGGRVLAAPGHGLASRTRAGRPPLPPLQLHADRRPPGHRGRARRGDHRVASRTHSRPAARLARRRRLLRRPRPRQPGVAAPGPGERRAHLAAHPRRRRLARVRPPRRPERTPPHHPPYRLPFGPLGGPGRPAPCP
ncbi:hypothetical protein [Streptomyces virginiae]|uniref:hypothetical protein n=1 Tax=Streptomyces virginiae TaxID=1961 RepID=UPI003249DE80